MGCGASKPAYVEPLLATTNKTPSTGVKQSNPVVAPSKSPLRPAAGDESGKASTTQNPPPQSHEPHSEGAAATTAKPKLENGNVSDPFPSIVTAPLKAPATAALEKPATAALEKNMTGTADPQWRELWNANKDKLVDPADVHATLQDLMAVFTNKLSETELLMLQRKVRSAVRKANATDSNHNKRKARKNNSFVQSSNSNGSSHIFQDSAQHDPRSVAEKFHLLTPNVVRRVLPTPPSPLSNLRNNLALTKSPSNDSNKSLGSLASASDANGSSSSTGGGGPAIRLVETTYLLALYCGDSLWDRVADIALQSAKANDLEMDVNKQTIQKQKQESNGKAAPPAPIPEPCQPTTERLADPPPGVGLHALSFLLALALSKYPFYRYWLIAQEPNLYHLVPHLDLIAQEGHGNNS